MARKPQMVGTTERGKKKATGKKAKESALDKRAKPIPLVDVGCETCTVECQHRADGKRCTRWEHVETKASGTWTVVKKGRKLTAAERARKAEELPRHSWWRSGAWCRPQVTSKS